MAAHWTRRQPRLTTPSRGSRKTAPLTSAVRVKTMRIIIAALILLYATAAYATNPCSLYRYGADFKGTCTKANYLSQDNAEICPGKVIYGLLKDGFGVFGFYIEGVGNIYFMGPDKSKPNLKNNRLLLTGVDILDAKGKTSRKAAKGECTMMQDLKGLTAIMCNATIAAGNLNFNFTSNLAPDILDCEETE